MPTSLPAIVIATALLAYLATAVQPSVNASDLARLDAAAEHLTHLLRYAQAESIRTGEPHGITYTPGTRTFSVVKADTSVEPFVAQGVIYDPHSRQPMSWQLDAWLTLTPANAIFDFGGYGTWDQVMFDAWGTPVLPMGGRSRPLVDTALVLSSADHQRKVSITRINGRVKWV